MTLNNIPPGCLSSRATEVRFRCNHCKTEFDVPAVLEMGSLSLIDEIDDPQCPDCGNDDEDEMTVL